MADNVKLVLEFDSTGAIAGVKNFGTNLKTETQQVGGALDGLSNKLAAVGAAVVAYFAVGAIKDFFGTIIKEASDTEVQMNNLNGALKRAGSYSLEASKAMGDYASAMMATTTIDDDVIIAQLAIARNFTKTDEEARKLVSAAVDLSAAMDEDLGTSVELLGRTLDGTAGRMNEMVPSIRGISVESLKAGGAIDAIAKAFGGAAENQVKTFGGAMIQVKNAMVNVQSAMGEVITRNPIIIAAINEISKMLMTLEGSLLGNRDGAISFMNQGLLSIISGIRSVLPYLNILISTFKILYNAEVIIKEALMNFLNSLILVGSGIGILIEKFTGGQKAAYMFQTTLDDISKRGDKMSEALKNIGKDAFSKMDLKAVDEAFARIAAAAKNNPVKIDANLNTGKIKEDLGKVEASINTDIKPVKAESPAQEVKVEGLRPKIEEMFPKTLGNINERGAVVPTAIEDLLISLFGSGKTKQTAKAPDKNGVLVDKEVESVTAGRMFVMTAIYDTIKELDLATTFFATNMRAVSPLLGGSILTLGNKIGSAIWITSGIVTDSYKAIKTAFDASKAKIPDAGFFSNIGAAIQNVNWENIGANVKDAFLTMGYQAAQFAGNLASSAVTAGVAVAGTAVTSTVANIGKGEAGAKGAIVDTIGAMGSAFDKALGTGSMIGDILKSFLNALSDPEALKGLINGFINAIPTIIDSMIEAIPVLMDGIVRALPVLLDGIIRMIPVLFEAIAKGIGPILITLADKIPDIIIAIAENLGPIVEAIADALPTIITKLIAAIPRVATALVKAFLGIIWTLISKAIPNIIQGLLTGISKMFSNIGSGLKMGGMKSLTGGDGADKAKKLLSGGASSIDMSAVQKKLIEGGKKLFTTFSVDIPKKILEGVKKLGKLFYVDIPMKIWEGVKKLGEFLYITVPMKIWEGVKALVTWFWNLGMQIWNQGIMPLINWFINLGAMIWNQGILPLVTWFAGLFQAIWDQGIMPLVTWFAGLFQAIWDQGILPLVNWFANLFVNIWNQGILPMVNWFRNLGSTIWNQGVIPLVNWFLNLGANIWNNGIIPLVDWFKELPSKLWDALQSGIKNMGKIGGGSGGLLGGKVIPGLLATGGVVPKGYPNDSYPALLTSGETVVPADSAAGLFAAIDSLNKGGGQANSETNALLRQLIALIAGQQTTVNVQLDRNVLAKAILTLNMDNRRIA